MGFEIRGGDDDARACVEAITHRESMLLLRAEREFLRLLDAGCHTPVGVRSWIHDGILHMAGRVFDEDSMDDPTESSVTGPAAEPEQVAGELFTTLS